MILPLTGFDGMEAIKYTDSPLPAVEQRLEELGKVAAEILVESTKGGDKKIKTYRTPRSKKHYI